MIVEIEVFERDEEFFAEIEISHDQTKVVPVGIRRGEHLVLLGHWGNSEHCVHCEGFFCVDTAQDPPRCLRCNKTHQKCSGCERLDAEECRLCWRPWCVACWEGVLHQETCPKGKDASVALCKEHGWGPGTQLVGHDELDEDVIEILYVGEQTVLAKHLWHNGEPPEEPQEATWTLVRREWEEYLPERKIVWKPFQALSGVAQYEGTLATALWVGESAVEEFRNLLRQGSLPPEITCAMMYRGFPVEMFEDLAGEADPQGIRILMQAPDAKKPWDPTAWIG